jgi:hypothetical protein
MPPFDIEMVEPLQERMRAKGVQLHLGDGVAGFEQAEGGGLSVLTQSGKKHAADLVLLVRWGRLALRVVHLISSAASEGGSSEHLRGHCRASFVACTLLPGVKHTPLWLLPTVSCLSRQQ